MRETEAGRPLLSVRLITDEPVAYVAEAIEEIRLLPPAESKSVARNHLETLEACRAEYIALCDGDE